MGASGKRATISEKVAYGLERLVLDGDLSPGDRLPPERELAERFGASRNAVREAIRKLEAMGLLSTAAQSGTYVRDYLEEASFDLVVYLLGNAESHDPAAFESMMEYREMLEATAASMAAERDPGSCGADLAALSGRLSAALGVDEMAEADYLFHSRLVKASGNLLFRSLHNTSRTAHLFYTRRFFAAPGARDETVAQQLAIAAAIGRGDKAAAADAVRAALAYGRRVAEGQFGLD